MQNAFSAQPQPAPNPVNSLPPKPPAPLPVRALTNAIAAVAPQPALPARRTSTAATVLAILSLSFGFGSVISAFFPIIGGLALVALVPCILLAGLAVVVALVERARRMLPVIALVVLLFGALVAWVNYMTFDEQTKAAEHAIHQEFRRVFDNNTGVSSRPQSNATKAIGSPMRSSPLQVPDLPRVGTTHSPTRATHQRESQPLRP